LDSLPDVVTNTLQEYIDAANKGLMNWVFRHRGAKLISILSLPYVLPIDIAHATFLRFMDVAPKVGNNLALLAGTLAKYLVVLIQKFDKKRRQFNAKFTCQLAITEYAEMEGSCSINKKEKKKKKTQKCAIGKLMYAVLLQIGTIRSIVAASFFCILWIFSKNALFFLVKLLTAVTLGFVRIDYRCEFVSIKVIHGA
jgi:hypothetical protein